MTFYVESVNAQTRVMDVSHWQAAGMDEQLDALDAAVTEDGFPNIAVMSDPFGGRDAFIDHAEALCEDKTVERITLDSLGTTPESFGLDDNDVVLVEDCQYLFRRRIGGFDALEAFAQEAASAETTVVTSWNSYAWDYLMNTKHLDQLFSHQLAVPKLSPETMQSYLRERVAYDDVSFVDDRDEEPVISRGHWSLNLGRYSPSVPYPRVNLGAIDTDEQSVEETVMQAITDRSDGLPGVATAVWDASIEDDQIGPNRIVDGFGNVDIDETTAYALRTVLMNGAIQEDALETVIEQHAVRRVLREMAQHELVTIDDAVRLNPLALKTVRKELERRRLLW